ncbi:DUF3135 domain-containing protein [Pseudogulbenkiania sp. MAI-1]|uniref:DUF3135 domain-containing protein n=1 Tax=Pseudogulbenkiania sp. MAI-1 TaxID=990370 RepID=UPI00045E65C7|nr:DUF3135 domain-containing protein [Pseudogulbenkiania sp. MAI-1]
MAHVRPYRFVFEQWQALYEHDPQAFERKRRAVLRQLIDASDDPAALTELQVWIDLARAQAKDPLDACQQISAMMWRSYFQLLDARAKLVDSLNSGGLGMQTGGAGC